MLALSMAALVLAEPVPPLAEARPGWWQGRRVVEVPRPGLRFAELSRRAEPGTLLRLPSLFPSSDEAGLAPTSFSRLDPRFGTPEELGAALSALHAADVAVVVEFPANRVSVEHEWFLEARRGEPGALSRFVLFEEEVAFPGQPEALSYDPGLHRWFYRSGPAGTADLAFGDGPTRGLVLRAVEALLDRGFDGLAIADSRRLVEEGPGRTLDRPASLALLGELAERVGRRGGVLWLEPGEAEAAVVDRHAALGASVLVEDVARGRALDRALAGRDAKAVARLLGVSAAPSGPPPLFFAGVTHPLAEPLLAAAGALREGSGAPTPAALRFGARRLLDDRDGALVFVTQHGVDAVLVVAELAGRRGTLALDLGRTPFRAGDELVASDGGPPVRVGGRRLVLPARPGAVTVFTRVRDPRRAELVFADAAVVSPMFEPGQRFGEARGFGFSREVERRCAKVGRRSRCGHALERRSGAEAPRRFGLSLPSGPYLVEVEVLEPTARLLIEGELSAARGGVAKAEVFVADGFLAIEAELGAGPVTLARLVVSPARFEPRLGEREVVVAKDRVVVTAGAPGVVKWRMDGSSAEPVESTPIVRRGQSFVATLGPWPAGAVREVSFVIRSAAGFLTAEGGREYVAKLP